nr:MAG TPA: hypothetical protein [Caudoviricetes sp.]
MFPYSSDYLLTILIAPRASTRLGVLYSVTVFAVVSIVVRVL